jgi:hypothetical protein
MLLLEPATQLAGRRRRSASATIAACPHRSRPERPSHALESARQAAQDERSGLNAFYYDWPLRGSKRTFSPFHRGVVTTYALEVGAAGDGDNRDHSFSALRTARCLIHEILPIFTPNYELKLLFHRACVCHVPPRRGHIDSGVPHSCT